ncbi:MAG: PP2C family protein-serine/threonine phosphatase, partial [Thermoguttaceae bacterium]
HTSDVDIKAIMDSLIDGVYVCDLEIRITYWSKSAERITGWSAEDVVGLRCLDNVLCHIDKDGHQLCGEEFCPLHRSMITDTGSNGSLLVYAQGKSGGRIPMLVSVSPMRDATGQVIGGVETFRDASSMVHDLERAKAIQQLALAHDIPEDARLALTTHYIPHEIVGGDYYAIQKIGDDQYALILADVMGHGIAGALYTMHLSQLWQRYHGLLTQPVDFAAKVNNELAKVVKTDESFATAVCGLVDLKEQVFRFASAGGPQVLLMHSDGNYECLEGSGLPLAVMEDAPYEETSTRIRAGDSLLLFSDGVIEIHNAHGKMLDIDGLVTILRKQGYPGRGIDMAALEEELLRYSNAIRLADDLTMIEVRFAESMG